MLATKNRVWRMVLLLLGTTLLLTACSRDGAGALRAGKKLLDAGQAEPAIAALQQAVQLLPTNAAAWNYLGVAYHQAGQWTNAADAYIRALRFNRDLLEVRFNLGCLWLEQNRWADAKTELTAYTLRRGNDAAGWTQLGLAQYQTREWTGAEKSFREAIQLEATNAAAWNGLGLALAQRNRWREAAEAFNTALQLSPDDRAALLNLATVEQQQGNTTTAVRHYREYLARQPRAADWEAVNAVVEALVPPPVTNPVPRAATSEVAAPSHSTRTTNKVSVAREPAAAEGKPAAGDRKAAQAALAQGQQAQQARKLAEATQYYRRAVALDPGYFEAQYCLGLATYETRNFKAATAAWEAALKLQPDSVAARYNYALTLKADGQNQPAAAELEKLLALHPDEARAHLILGILYAEKIPDLPRARKHYQRVLQLDPQNSQASAIRAWLAAHPG